MHREHPQHLLEHQGPGRALVHGQLVLSPATVLLWIFRRRTRWRVQGESMLPEYADGDQVLVNPHAWKQRAPTPGEVVLLQHPDNPTLKLMKRISHVEEDGRLFVQGDNTTQSTDSREFGPVHPNLLWGAVEGKLT